MKLTEVLKHMDSDERIAVGSSDMLFAWTGTVDELMMTQETERMLLARCIDKIYYSETYKAVFFKVHAALMV